MGPWKLIGVVAGGAGAIAAVTGLFFLIQGAVSWILDANTKDVLSQVQAETHRWELIVRDNADAARVLNGEMEDAASGRETVMQEKINGLFDTIDQQLDESPYLVDIALHRQFYDLLCQVENLRDNEARAFCSVHAATAPTPDRSPFLSINKDIISGWEDLCDDTGADEYCSPTAISLRKESVRELLGWMSSVIFTLEGYERVIFLLNQQLEQAAKATASTVEEQ